MEPIKCYVVPVTSYQENCTLVSCESTGKAVIVDPGGDVPAILVYCPKQNIYLIAFFGLCPPSL